MKIELEIENDLLWFDDNEENNIIVYCVRCTKFFPYKDQDNYLRHREEYDELKADSITALYEQMGKAVVDHMIYGEKESQRDSWNHPLKEFTVEFSNIYIEVEYYKEERMKNSESYKNIGAAKERDRIREEEKRIKEEERRRKSLAAERERKDKEEYERLRKKFGNH